MTKTKEVKQENDRLCAILNYLIIGMIWYLADEKMKKNSFVKYHFKQGLVLLIFEIITSLVMGVPLLGWLIAPIFYILVFVFIILGIINAANNQEKPLPIIGGFADNFKF